MERQGYQSSVQFTNAQRQAPSYDPKILESYSSYSFSKQEPPQNLNSQRQDPRGTFQNFQTSSRPAELSQDQRASYWSESKVPEQVRSDPRRTETSYRNEAKVQETYAPGLRTLINDPKQPDTKKRPTTATTKTANKTKTQISLEDEYIHNLQQQIYFLELELKLLKEKEKDEKSMFPLDGMETGPLNESIFALKAKYKKLQADLEARLTVLGRENRDLATRHLSLQMSLEKAIEDYKEAEGVYRENIQYFNQETEKYRKQLNGETLSRDDIMKRLAEITKEKELAKTWANELKLKFDKQDLTIKKTMEKLEAMESYKNYVVEEKNKQIIDLQKQIAILQEKIDQDTTITSLRVQLEEITKKINEVAIERDEYLNKSRGLEYAKDLIEKSCAQLLAEKKQLAVQIVELKNDMEKEKVYQETQLNKKLREIDSKDMRIAIKQIEDSRKEAVYSMEQFKSKYAENVALIEETNKLKEEFIKEKNKYETLIEEHRKHEENVKKFDAEFHETSYNFKQLLERNSQLEVDKRRSGDDSKKLFSENSELRAQVFYLSKKLEMNDQLKNIDLDELKSLSKTNVQINGAIGQLLTVWDGIEHFQKTQP
ncbi:unnamed protein product [Blepharisma stoltei]|uniref:Uncharacterized protein n=1 Tax=Blepharisma stoltei TaxID=1481888 RepID=A0AAU9J7W9_9CILI|nr:unnamed protein product [Blepharisma stoltei]